MESGLPGLLLLVYMYISVYTNMYILVYTNMSINQLRNTPGPGSLHCCLTSLRMTCDNITREFLAWVHLSPPGSTWVHLDPLGSTWVKKVT